MKQLFMLALAICLFATLLGCSTYRAYPGQRRPRADVALISVPGGMLRVDGQDVERADTRRVELLPGPHVLEWVFVYPNRYRETQTIEFTAVAGRRYHLGQRFFPGPDPAGPIGAVFDIVTDVATAPFELIVPPEPPSDPPHGDYHAWITEQPTRRVVAGLAPDVPRGHAPITYVPLDDGRP